MFVKYQNATGIISQVLTDKKHGILQMQSGKLQSLFVQVQSDLVIPLTTKQLNAQVSGLTGKTLIVDIEGTYKI